MYIIDEKLRDKSLSNKGKRYFYEDSEINFGHLDIYDFKPQTFQNYENKNILLMNHFLTLLLNHIQINYINLKIFKIIILVNKIYKFIRFYIKINLKYFIYLYNIQNIHCNKN